MKINHKSYKILLRIITREETNKTLINHTHRHPEVYSGAGRRLGVPSPTPPPLSQYPEKKLNYFVRAIALIERQSNALDMLAFKCANIMRGNK